MSSTNTGSALDSAKLEEPAALARDLREFFRDLR